jgi:hypothetical protein
MALRDVFTLAMKYPVSPLVLAIGLSSPSLLAIGSAESAGLARVQTAFPAAVPIPAQARPDFSGTWSLDRSISTDLGKASFEPATDRSRQGGGRRGGGFGGGGFGGRGGFGGSGGSRSRYGDSPSDSTPDERARLSALTDQLKKGAATLVISHHDPSFVINDSLDHTQFFQTTGSSDEHQLASTKVTSTTRWEESRLITEYDLGSRKLVYTYALLPATRQMVLRVRLEANGSQRATGPEIKLVFTQPASH